MAKTFVQAVIEAVELESDFWQQQLEDGKLADACVRNRLTGSHGQESMEYCLMRYAIVRNTKMGLEYV